MAFWLYQEKVMGENVDFEPLTSIIAICVRGVVAFERPLARQHSPAARGVWYGVEAKRRFALDGIGRISFLHSLGGMFQSVGLINNSACMQSERFNK